ncbi:RGG repeats nuclear RNA binding protein A-like [Vigna umbellata]|uniref:RGG repeats nuclear RNA binding protein A-like n=1 Tax=Vigna umbellata TaxID=87088 RepID=UPI001F5FB5D6|nr:RGG repeats nuclear RNA binding protein A-like [Vigna umbellata]
MATANPFDLLGDDAEDPSQLIAAEQLKAAAAPKKEQGKAGPRAGAVAQQSKPAQLPSKPVPPTQAVREAKNETSYGCRGGGRGYGRGRGGGSGFGRDFSNEENSSAPANQGSFEGEAGNPSERRGYGAPRGPYRGSGRGRRGGFSNGEVGDDGRPRRAFERHSGTGRGNEFKRDGAGRGNWGTQSDEIAQVTEEVADETEKNLGDEKPVGEEDAAGGNKDSPATENEEKEPEDKEMTLEEYEKVLEERRKALQALKTETRKVDIKEFATMQPLSNKKDNDEIFIKLGSEKDKRKDALEKEERSKKSVNINEFLKPAEGERYYNTSGRGRGRGRGARGGYSGNAGSNVAAPSIEDPGQFPTLGGK